MWWNIHAKFRIGDYQFKEVDITPALGLSLIVVVFVSLLQVSHWTY